MTGESTGLRATCYYCDGPLPITRSERDGRVWYWAACPEPTCARQFWITGVEGTDNDPVFCMIPYFHNPTTSGEWLGMKRPEQEAPKAP